MRHIESATAEPLVSRRSFLQVATAAGATLLVPGCQQTPAPQAVQNKPDARMMLEKNEEVLEKINTYGVQAVMDDMRRKGHDLFAKGDPTSTAYQCIDERYLDEKRVHGLAGLGVHHEKPVRQKIAEGIIRNARKKLQEQQKLGMREPVTIELEWHGKRTGGETCGAALVALKKQDAKGDTWFKDEQIDDMAENGALLLKSEIERQLTGCPDRGSIVVIVKGVDAEHFVHADYHPGQVVLINGSEDVEYNRENGSGLLAYETDYTIVPQVAVDDALLAGKIITGNHGRIHAKHGKNGGKHANGEPDRPIFVPVGSEQQVKPIIAFVRDSINALPPADRHNFKGSRIEPYILS